MIPNSLSPSSQPPAARGPNAPGGALVMEQLGLSNPGQSPKVYIPVKQSKKNWPNRKKMSQKIKKKEKEGYITQKNER